MARPGAAVPRGRREHRRPHDRHHSAETNVIENLVGSYDDLTEPMALAARGLVELHTAKYALDDVQTAIDDRDGGRVRGRTILLP